MVHTNEDLIALFEKRLDEKTAACREETEASFEKRLDEKMAAFRKEMTALLKETTALRKDVTAMQGDLKRLLDFADESCSYMRDQRESILTAQKLTTEGELITDFAYQFAYEMNRSKNKRRVRELLEKPADTFFDMKEPRNDQNHRNFQGAMLKRLMKDSDAHTSQRKRKLIRDILTDQKDEIDAFKRQK